MVRKIVTDSNRVIGARQPFLNADGTVATSWYRFLNDLVASANVPVVVRSVVSGSGFWHSSSGLLELTARAVNLSGADVTGTLAAARFPAIAGDITVAAGSLTAVLPVVNPNVGTFANATVTVNAKGQITAAVNGSSGVVASISNSDGSLTISPTTGAAVASLNVSHANTWAATQTFAALVATTFNGNHWTAGTGTLAIGAGKTLTASNTLTFTGIDASSVDFGAGGTVLYAGPGAGTVTSVSVVTANGVSGSVATATTTPAITLTLNNITPASVAAVGTITGSNLSGTNTGNQTITLTGDVTGSGTGSFAATLATVNSNVGSFTNASITVNGKGLITAASSGSAGATSVSNSDGSLTISPTTGAVVASLNVAHANLWTAAQTITLASPGAGAPAYSALFVASGNAANYTALSVGRTVPEFYMGVAGAAGDYLAGTAAGDGVLFATSGAKIRFGIANVGGTAQNVISSTGIGIGVGSTANNAALEVRNGTGITSFTGTTIGNAILSGPTASGDKFATLDFTETSDPTIPNARIGAKFTSTGSQLHFGVSNLYASGITTDALIIDQTGAAAFASSIVATGAISGSNLSGTNTGNQTITLTGDVTGSGTGSFAATLATVNSNIGTFGSATQASVVTVNAKGLVTAASNVTITPAAGSLTGLGTGVGTALAVNVGSAGAFVVNGGALGTPSSGTLTSATGLPISTGVSGLASGIATWLATPSSVNLLAAMTTKTGTGSLVFGTSPTLSAPSLGTPLSVDLTNATNLPLGAITGFGTGVATALAVNVGTAGAFVVNGGALGTPSSGVATNLTGTAAGLTAGNVTTNANLTGDVTSVGNATTLATVNSNVGTFGSATQASVVTVNAKGLTTAASNVTITPAVGSITGFGTGVATWLATPSSANLLAAVTDETGTGALVFGTAPTIANPIITNIAPGADFSITQNSVAAFKSLNTSAVVNTVVLKAGKVGMGTAVPTFQLTVSANTAAVPANTNSASEVWLFNVAGADSVRTGMGVDSFGTGNTAAFSIIDFRRANGTAASPSALQSGDLIGVLGAFGYGTTAYSDGCAQFRYFANETFSDTANGSRIEILTTPNGSTATAGVAKIASFANAGIVFTNPSFSTAGTQTLTTAGKGVIEISNTVTNNAAGICAYRARNTFNGSGSGVGGFDVLPTYAPSASIAVAQNILGAFLAPPTTVTITDAYGLNVALLYNDVAGAVTTGTAFRLGAPTISGALKPTTQYGIRVLNQGASGMTLSNGILIDAQSGATTSNALVIGGSSSGSTALNASATASGIAVLPPSGGTLATLAGTETLTNKTLTSPTLTTPAIGVASGTSLTLSSLTAGRVPYASTAGLLADTANFVWDNSNTRLGIGGTPTAQLHVLKGGTGPQTVAIFENTDAGATTTEGRVIWANNGGAFCGIGGKYDSGVPYLGFSASASAVWAEKMRIDSNGKLTIASGGVLKLGNAAVTGLVAGAVAALTTATITVQDSTGTTYRIPCVI